MIRPPRPECNVLRIGFEDSVGDDSETRPPIHQVCVENGNVLFDRCRVECIGKVLALRFVDDRDHLGGLDVSTDGTYILIPLFHRDRPAAFPPDISLKYVVIVRCDDGWTIAHKITEGPAEHVPFAEIIQDGLIGRETDDVITAVAFINLVT